MTQDLKNENMKNKKSKIPYFFFAFFGVIFMVNFAYIYVSQKTWTGITTQDSYRKGLKYNEALLAKKNQELLGWQIKIKYLNDGNKNGVLKVDLLDKKSNPIKDAKVVVNFKRPTQEGFDFSRNLEFLRNQYQAQIIFPLKGQWDFEIIASKDENLKQEAKRYVVQ